MAEWVQSRLEDRFQELEQLERVGLFTTKEIRAIVKKVTALEYRVLRCQISKQDYLAYIQYEINLLALLKKRRKATGYHFKKEIEYASVTRIHTLFKRAEAKWKDDLQLWLSHIKFCKLWKCKLQLSKLYASVLAIHPNKIVLWLMAAKWELEENRSSDGARSLFLRALRFHPDSRKLFQEYFRMELLHAHSLHNRRNLLLRAKIKENEHDFPQCVMNGDVARVVYRNATVQVPDAKFHVLLLNIAKLFSFTQKLCAEMQADLWEHHSNDPATWDIFAKQQLKQHLVAAPLMEAPVKGSLSLAKREKKSYTVYEEAIKVLNTEEMWRLYINFCLWRLRKRKTRMVSVKKMMVYTLSVFERAHDAGLLGEKLHMQWVKTLQKANMSDKAKTTAREMVRKFPLHVHAWITLARLLWDDPPAALSSFQEGFAALPENEVLPLWLLQMKWSEDKQSIQETEQMYQSVLASSRSLSSHAKARYLFWANDIGGYKKARRVFCRLHGLQPHILQFFSTMLDIEKQGGNSIHHLRDCYERCLHQFGPTEPDMWLRYIKEELSHPSGSPVQCGHIFWRATQSLQDAYRVEFKNKYAGLQAGMDLDVKDSD
uniref:U3 small nucleolar RNA-associated protein 6 homolog isoform X2 n=1 Tax=Myxine glutinosa TaxID=7769 RepID=UPI00358EFA98